MLSCSVCGFSLFFSFLFYFIFLNLFAVWCFILFSFAITWWGCSLDTPFSFTGFILGTRCSFWWRMDLRSIDVWSGAGFDDDYYYDIITSLTWLHFTHLFNILSSLYHCRRFHRHWKSQLMPEVTIKSEFQVHSPCPRLSSVLRQISALPCDCFTQLLCAGQANFT